MVTRRDTLSFAIAGVIGGLSASHTLGARAAAMADLANSTGSTGSTGLPPAIASLSSQAHRLVPISVGERQARFAKAQALLQEQHLAGMILAEGTSLNYFTGVSWWGSERLFALLLPAKGAPLVMCPAFEEARAREQLTQGLGREQMEVRVWQEDQNPYEIFARAVKDRGISSGQLGLEESVRYVFASQIQQALPHAHFSSATPITAGCRMHKSPAEVALMRLASEVTLSAYAATAASIQVGMSQSEISELSRHAHARLGFEGAADLVLIDQSAAFPHGSVQPTRVKEGSLVLFDGGCTAAGYHSDITRTFVIGEPTAKMREVFAIVHAAQHAALTAAGPGVPCGEVDRAARAVITAAGFGPDYKTFTHRLGHGIGLDGHEWPYLVRGNPFKLSAGITTSNEPGIYLPGEFGLRLEDEMLITEHGAQLLTGQSVSLQAAFG